MRRENAPVHSNGGIDEEGGSLEEKEEQEREEVAGSWHFGGIIKASSCDFGMDLRRHFIGKV